MLLADNPNNSCTQTLLNLSPAAIKGRKSENQKITHFNLAQVSLAACEAVQGLQQASLAMFT